MDRSSQSVGSNGPNQPARKPRVALACRRCKRRKQRCDGGHPLCQSCERSGSSCVYERTIRPQYPGGKTLYINALEERIAFLEARMPQYSEDHLNYTSERSQPEKSHGSDANPHQVQLDSASSQHGSMSEDFDADDSHSLVDGVAYLSLLGTGTADNTPEPFYLGSSSGATIARMIQTSIFRNSGARAIPKGLGAVRSGSAAVHSQTPFAAADETLFDFPFFDQAQQLFDTFFDRLHTRWPLLDRKVYTVLFSNYYDNKPIPPVERSILHLIFAIASRFLQLTRNPCGVDPEKHLIAAIGPMDHILEQHSLGTVQFLLLLALHGQRSPYGAGAWSQVRYAVSLSIELGLHRERRVASPHHDARDLEVRRRAFWCCYCLDRGTSVLLGRAFTIADRDINVHMPNPSAEFWDLTHEEPADSSQPSQWSNVEPFIHVIKLERIQSRIHRTVFRVDKDVISHEREKLDTKMAAMRSDLDRWIESVPRPPKGAKKITWMYDPESANHDSQDFFSLHYHKAVLALFTVLLPTLDPTDHRFITSAQSAASVCIAYKRLNQQKTLSYTMISLHSCFVAGLTLVYCLWRNRSLFGYDVYEATQACSQSLTIFGEKWAGAVKYRDIFDALSGSLFKQLVNPTSLTSGMGGSSTNGASGKPQAKSRNNSLASGMSPEIRHSPSADVRTGTKEPSMSDMVSDAVKEAFMEVDEEAPGGWQGWRMWNEMLLGEEANTQQQQGSGWGFEFEGDKDYSADPMQSASESQGFSMECSGWDFGGVEGLR